MPDSSGPEEEGEEPQESPLLVNGKVTEHQRRTLLAEKQRELKEVLIGHDKQLRELYQMDRFVDMVYFDPSEAAVDHTQDFLKYQAEHDLIEQHFPELSTTQKRARRTSSDVSQPSEPPKSALSKVVHAARLARDEWNASQAKTAIAGRSPSPAKGGASGVMTGFGPALLLPWKAKQLQKARNKMAAREEEEEGEGDDEDEDEDEREGCLLLKGKGKEKERDRAIVKGVGGRIGKGKARAIVKGVGRSTAKGKGRAEVRGGVKVRIREGTIVVSSDSDEAPPPPRRHKHLPFPPRAVSQIAQPVSTSSSSAMLPLENGRKAVTSVPEDQRPVYLYQSNPWPSETRPSKPSYCPTPLPSRSSIATSSSQSHRQPTQPPIASTSTAQAQASPRPSARPTTELADPKPKGKAPKKKQKPIPELEILYDSRLGTIPVAPQWGQPLPPSVPRIPFVTLLDEDMISSGEEARENERRKEVLELEMEENSKRQLERERSGSQQPIKGKGRGKGKKRASGSVRPSPAQAMDPNNTDPRQVVVQKQLALQSKQPSERPSSVVSDSQSPRSQSLSRSLTPRPSSVADPSRPDRKRRVGAHTDSDRASTQPPSKKNRVDLDLFSETASSSHFISPTTLLPVPLSTYPSTSVPSPFVPPSLPSPVDSLADYGPYPSDFENDFSMADLTHSPGRAPSVKPSQPPPLPPYAGTDPVSNQEPSPSMTSTPAADPPPSVPLSSTVPFTLQDPRVSPPPAPIEVPLKTPTPEPPTKNEDEVKYDPASLFTSFEQLPYPSEDLDASPKPLPVRSATLAAYLSTFKLGLALPPPPPDEDEEPDEIPVLRLDDSDAVDLHEASVLDEASKRNKIAFLKKQGRLNELVIDVVVHPSTAGGLKKKGEGQIKRGGLHDQVLEELPGGHKAVWALADGRVNKVKKVRRAVKKYWDGKERKNREVERLEEKLRRDLARRTSRLVRAKWKMAVTVVQAKRDAVEQAERERLGQRQLDKILERSALLLHNRHAAHPTNGHPALSASDEYDSEEEESPSDGASEGEEGDGDVEMEDEGGSPSMDVADEFESDEEVPTFAPAATLEEEAEMSLEDLVRTYGFGLDHLAVAMEYVGKEARVEDGEEMDGELNSIQAEAAPIQTEADPVSTPAAPVSMDVALEKERLWKVLMLKFGDEADKRTGDRGMLAEADMSMEDLMVKYGMRHTHPDQDSSNPPTSVSSSPRIDVTSAAPGAPSAEPSRLLNGSSSYSTSFRTPIAESKQPEDTTSPKADLLVYEDDGALSPPSLSPARPVTPVEPPFLLRGNLRPYQQTGLEWLASLYNHKMNGILADEMGLGKTIQTIALLAYLACEKGMWGPHLIIVPTSVILNWEMEFKKFLPAFKILAYYGSSAERKEKRRGWTSENAFNVCITSYQLVVADERVFRNRQWHYMILDEAHHIKNFRSQRWQAMLGFNTQRRLLLTGTPLQNNLMELWSLLYFLTPDGLQMNDVDSGGFANHTEFMEWFSGPMDKAMEEGGVMSEDTKSRINRLHVLLRPYLLRRLKSEVEKELPGKFEHVVRCRLSKRQRFLYDEFMSRAETQESLATGNYAKITNCLMQLRKVCAHPDLFEVRPIVTSFAMQRSVAADYEIKELLVRRRLLAQDDFSAINLDFLNLRFTNVSASIHPTQATFDLNATELLKRPEIVVPEPSVQNIAGWITYDNLRSEQAAIQKWRHFAYINSFRCGVHPAYALETISLVRRMCPRDHLVPSTTAAPSINSLIKSTVQRAEEYQHTITTFSVIPPNAVALNLPWSASPGLDSTSLASQGISTDPFHHSAVAHQIAFPDASLLQYDCGKLQRLYEMLRDFKTDGHRVLIFTQMTKVLDILEMFLSSHGHRYLRLDGSTKVEQRQILTERFNTDDRVFCFIASTRSGGVGINLTGADTVIFYDSDWNPALDKQCQDRAHRIGQTREVNIYRLVSEHTVEENMLKKANQKRMLDSVVIQDGNFTTDYAGKMSWKDLLGDTLSVNASAISKSLSNPLIVELFPIDLARGHALAEDEEDRRAGIAALEEMELDPGDFADAAAGDHDEDEALEGVDRYLVNRVEEDWEYFEGV